MQLRDFLVSGIWVTSKYNKLMISLDQFYINENTKRLIHYGCSILPYFVPFNLILFTMMYL